MENNNVDLAHVCTGVLSNASGFPTIPENIAATGREERNKLFDELINGSLLDIEKSKNKTSIILKAFEIVLEYMDETDVSSTIDYPKPVVQKVYENLKLKWT